MKIASISRMGHAFVLAILLTIIPTMRAQSRAVQTVSAGQNYVGFDSNDYPGDSALPVLRTHLSFVGYWLTNPPGARRNGWVGKREILLRQGFGFLVLANGRLDKEIGAAHVKPEVLGQKDAAIALSAAAREHFPPHTILFLDQEEGGRLLPRQMAYLLGWAEAVSNAGYRPGVYASGQTVNEGPGKTITTAQDIQEHVAAQHLHEIALWVYQDGCPPAPGCTLQPPALSASGSAGAVVWQYAQSPRRPEITAVCAKTYAAGGTCSVPELKSFFLDLDVSASSDPSQGR